MSDKLDQFTQTYLLERFIYYPETGDLWWRPKPNPIWRQKIWNTNFAGKRAGTSDKDGYIIILLDRVAIKAHRLIWRMMTGMVPPEDVDHVDRVPSNNKWVNLRLATKKQNPMNQSIYKNNRSGHRGVFWYATNKRWRAYIRRDGKQYDLGSYRDIDDAIAARLKAEQEMFGEFAPSWIGGSG